MKEKEEKEVNPKTGKPYKFSKKSRAKISKELKKRWKTPGKRLQIALKMLGKKQSPETCKLKSELKKEYWKKKKEQESKINNDKENENRTNQ